MNISPLIDPFALRKDGTTPLEGDWGVGGFDIRLDNTKELSGKDVGGTARSLAFVFSDDYAYYGPSAGLNGLKFQPGAAVALTIQANKNIDYAGTLFACTGGDLTITASGGDISLDDENLKTTGHAAFGSSGVVATTKIIDLRGSINSTTVHGAYVDVNTSMLSGSSGNYGGIYSRIITGDNQSYGTTGDFYGAKIASEFTFNAAGGSINIGDYVGLDVSTYISKLASSGTITNVYGIRLTSTFDSGKGSNTLSNVFGIYIPDQTAANDYYTANNIWAIYSLGGNSYHAGNFSIGSTTLDGTADKVLQIANGTEPGGVVTDAIQLYSKNSTSGSPLATLGLYLEEPPVVVGTFTPSHKFRLWINGTEYWIRLDAVS